MTDDAIHPTAVIDPSTRLADGVRIGPYAIVGAGVTLEEGACVGTGSLIGADALQPPSWSQTDAVTLGEGVVVGAYCRISGDVVVGSGTEIFDGCRLRGALRIGSGTRLFDGVVIGNPGQFPGRHLREGCIEIGENCVLREGVTVTQPVLSALTTIGPESYLMARTQVDHDCRLGRGIKTGAGVTLGGSVEVGDYAYLGMNAVVHQRTVIGAHTMIGMNGVVMRHVPPYAVLVNRRFTRINRRGLEARGWKEEVIGAVERFYQSGFHLDEAPPESWAGPIRSFLDRIGDDGFEGPTGK